MKLKSFGLIQQAELELSLMLLEQKIDNAQWCDLYDKVQVAKTTIATSFLSMMSFRNKSEAIETLFASGYGSMRECACLVEQSK